MQKLSHYFSFDATNPNEDPSAVNLEARKARTRPLFALRGPKNSYFRYDYLFQRGSSLLAAKQVDMR